MTTQVPYFEGALKVCISQAALKAVDIDDSIAAQWLKERLQALVIQMQERFPTLQVQVDVKLSA